MDTSLSHAELHLLPRRAEILGIVRDHKMVTFDTIRRRFIPVAISTLHYDLQQLMKVGLIRKLGSTRGALYVPNGEKRVVTIPQDPLPSY
jgi:hypothetical protein